MGRGKLCKRWYEGGYGCKPVLELLLPHLRIKRKQALLALEFLGLDRKWHRTARADFHGQMHVLNCGAGNKTESAPRQSQNLSPVEKT